MQSHKAVKNLAVAMINDFPVQIKPEAKDDVKAVGRKVQSFFDNFIQITRSKKESEKQEDAS
jgi:hypothetical protein